MELNKIQIVSFNNPFPPNYGGVIDVYYKIKYLHQLNIDIYLHIFTDDRVNLGPIRLLCKEIYVYKRNKSYLKLISKLPFGVASRKSDQIYNNLNKRDALILFEGLQSTEVLRKHTFKNKIAVRTHNIEHFYYYGLSQSSRNPFKKWIYKLEARKYERYQHLILSKVDAILPLSNKEFRYFDKNFRTAVAYVPVFHGNEVITNPSLQGDYALYHGDLSIADNVASAKFLVSVFAELPHKLYVASSVYPTSLKNLIERHDHIQFKKIGKTQDEIESLISNAHVNILYSNQATGTKLKVFNALFKGGFCIVNDHIVDDETILSLCEVANSKDEIKQKANEIFNKTFELTEERKFKLNQFLPINHAKLLKSVFGSLWDAEKEPHP